MGAQWEGRVRLADADAKPGHYYVSVTSRGRVALALGPFTQRGYGRDGHARALGYVRRVRRYVQAHDHSADEPWYGYGTARLDLYDAAPAGKLNDVLLGTKGA